MKKLLLIFILFAQVSYSQLIVDRQADPKSAPIKETYEADGFITEIPEDADIYYTHMKRGVIESERAKWERDWLPVTSKVTFDKLNNQFILSVAGYKPITVHNPYTDAEVKDTGFIYITGYHRGFIVIVLTNRQLRLAFSDGTALKLAK